MAFITRKKNMRQRGSKTHGYGSMKKNRGAGNRGGRGNAGTGKRGDANKPKIWTKKYFGKYGFKSKNQFVVKSINIVDLEKGIEGMVKRGKIKEDNDIFILNLNDLGYNKLLSKGNITKKFKIKTRFASKRAIEKIKAAGGEVELLQTKEFK